ncbi:MAG TPA: pyridoxine 5'-phosphate synthase [Vicinamibacteria bacterium]|nr:pyridoxine 5'-phosphate synthase [Vicinamibacteria bacterium]
MIELGVTLDAVALLRESRKTRGPDPVFAAFLAEQAGASAINVQLRSDRRHIQERDVRLLRESVGVELNLVITPSQEMIRFALTAKPDRVTFIPERLESAGGGGLDVLLNTAPLKERMREMRESSILPGIFIDPSIDQVKAAHQVGAVSVTIATEAFAAASDQVGLARDREAIDRELQRFSDCARLGSKLDLHVSASHGLTLRKARLLLDIPGLARIDVGHALISKAVMIGFASAVSEWIELLHRRPKN